LVFNRLDSKYNYNAATNNRPYKVGTLAVDGLAVTFGTARRGLGGWDPAQSPPRCIKCNSPPINGQCTSHSLYCYDGQLLCSFNVAIKGLNLDDSRACFLPMSPTCSWRRDKRQFSADKEILAFLEEYKVLIKVARKEKAVVQKTKSRISKIALDTLGFEESDTNNAML